MGLRGKSFMTIATAFGCPDNTQEMVFCFMCGSLWFLFVRFSLCDGFLLLWVFFWLNCEYSQNNTA